MSILQSKTASPFGQHRVVHYFKRIEFQQRGSPHAHILLWLDNAPEDALGKDYDAAVALCDDLISVSASEASGNIKLQTHRHTFTCYKNVGRVPQVCRFEAPFMPCRTTCIFTPMPETDPMFKSYNAHYKNIRINLENTDYADIDDFYRGNNIVSDD